MSTTHHPREPRGTETPRPTDADGFRAAWAESQQRWAATVERARTLPPDAMHENVNGEWSFVQTLRHLIFVTDAWLRRGILGEPAPYHPLGLPPTGMKSVPAGDLEARPTLDEVLSVRAERTALVDGVMVQLTDEELDVERRVPGPGFPGAGRRAVRSCLLAVVGEEWQHRDYAERDLATLVREPR